jgi:hypothetical protein
VNCIFSYLCGKRPCFARSIYQCFRSFPLAGWLSS